MATRKKTPPRKSGATRQRSKSSSTKVQRRGLPGWLWGLAGLVAGFLISQHQHGTAPWQDSTDSPLAKVVPKPADDTDAAPEDKAAKAEAEESPMPTFEFYTLLPESEVVAPGGQMPDSTATPPPRPEKKPEPQKSDDAKPADDPIAQVIAARTTKPSAPPPESRPQTSDGKRYMLQAASFRATSDAQRLASRLRDFGLIANISEVKTGDGSVWHRVQAGPYTSRNELARAQDLMSTQGIEPLLIQLQN